eukprot:scaffold249954_cov28-Prasinocladus_malaysianus.AAC.1
MLRLIFLLGEVGLPGHEGTSAARGAASIPAPGDWLQAAAHLASYGAGRQGAGAGGGRGRGAGGRAAGRATGSQSPGLAGGGRLPAGSPA